MKNLISIKDLTKKDILDLIKLSLNVKKHPEKFKNKAFEKVLLTFFELPSLRTELSFDVAMFQMNGEVINYHSESSPWAHGKESIEDVSKVVSRYCDLVMIRMSEHNELLKFAKNSKIPVINGLTSYEHPCQILSDLMSIYEKKNKLRGLKLAYFGDANNNVTHSLIHAANILGINMTIACPNDKNYTPKVPLKKVKMFHNLEAAKNADIIYTDSWFSYRIPKSQYKRRTEVLRPYQVNNKVMSHAKKNALFMHCLPALRGYEVTKEVIDGKQSVVFDQAENRLHMQKAIIIKLLGI